MNTKVGSVSLKQNEILNPMHDVNIILIDPILLRNVFGGTTLERRK